MSESRLWLALNAGFKDKWDAERVDNRLAPGFPDVNYGMNGAGGFIELKYLCRWPKNGIIDLTKTFGKQFPDQRRWLIRRGSVASGRCFVFLWVQNNKLASSAEWLLFDQEALARMDLGPMKVPEFKSFAVGHWMNWINWDHLERLLTARRK